MRYNEYTQAVHIGFRAKENPGEIVSAAECKILDERILRAIELVPRVIVNLEKPAGIAQLEMAAGQNALAVIVRHLSEFSQCDLNLWHEYAQTAGVRLYFQPSGPDSVHLFYPEHTPEPLNYRLPEHDVVLDFHPSDFTQVHSGLNQLMINQALQLLDLKPQDRVLDLYCGMGNFALPMARKCTHVVGIEGSQTMVERAANNASVNRIQNTTFVCKNLERDHALDAFSTHEFQKVLLDPPRTGAQTMIRQMQRLQPERIVYVSCHPMTLARDTWMLVHEQGYRLAAAGVMDMFPHTAHVESMALFIK